MTISSEVKGHFLRLYQMAITDGEFTRAELTMLYKFAEERSISKADLDEILTHTTGIIKIPESLNTRVEYLYDLAVMIWADGVVSVDERATLQKYVRKFEFLDENVEAISNYFIESVKDGKTKLEILKEIGNG